MDRKMAGWNSSVKGVPLSVLSDHNICCKPNQSAKVEEISPFDSADVLCEIAEHCWISCRTDYEFLLPFSLNMLFGPVICTKFAIALSKITTTSWMLQLQCSYLPYSIFIRVCNSAPNKMLFVSSLSNFYEKSKLYCLILFSINLLI